MQRSVHKISDGVKKSDQTLPIDVGVVLLRKSSSTL